jgi:hypothetical protein
MSRNITAELSEDQLTHTYRAPGLTAARLRRPPPQLHRLWRGAGRLVRGSPAAVLTTTDFHLHTSTLLHMYPPPRK